MRTARLLAALGLGACLGMGRRPPEGTMDDPASLAAVGVSPSEWKGHSCSVSAPGARVVSDEPSWRALWKDSLGQEAPAVDFSRFVAVAVFAGAQRTGGWSAELLPPEAAAGAVVVPYRVRGPAPGAFVTMAFTSPYAVRLYRKPAGGLKTEQRR
ncbi:MAG: protease complex subunit PrcB family protein [Elusimicrobia bacterium]|nr:protease complex subunit PrcB family protein [Elusimicrobiota bacterium]